uniref:Uncharacterized protein n=1 Tax=Ditylenchus dipsaci TaxID=166011 RepID=A0A915CPC4_9BILA
MSRKRAAVALVELAKKRFFTDYLMFCALYQRWYLLCSYLTNWKKVNKYALIGPCAEPLIFGNQMRRFFLVSPIWPSSCSVVKLHRPCERAFKSSDACRQLHKKPSRSKKTASLVPLRSIFCEM